MVPARIAIVILFLSVGCMSYAADLDKCESHSEKEPVLCSYEPNTIGYTTDSDDSSFMDFKLSVKYQLIPDWSTRLLNCLHDDLGNNSAFYFAFTGRFGQYIGTRDSSPVVGKRFNPKLFSRYWTDEEHKDHIDLAYAHESDGQSINNAAQYQIARNAAEQPDFANDQLSRGWDYLELVWKKNLSKVKHKRMLTAYLTFKYFLPYGLLQKEPEEYNSWENNSEGKPRDEVNGLIGMLKFQKMGKWLAFEDIKLATSIETGYRRIFYYNTLRGEVGTKIFQLPLTIWGQVGNGSDLAQYYKNVTSWGIEAEIGSF